MFNYYLIVVLLLLLVLVLAETLPTVTKILMSANVYTKGQGKGQREVKKSREAAQSR